jgi:hypothetical protein
MIALHYMEKLRIFGVIGLQNTVAMVCVVRVNNIKDVGNLPNGSITLHCGSRVGIASNHSRLGNSERSEGRNDRLGMLSSLYLAWNSYLHLLSSHIYSLKASAIVDTSTCSSQGQVMASVSFLSLDSVFLRIDLGFHRDG